MPWQYSCMHWQLSTSWRYWDRPPYHSVLGESTCVIYLDYLHASHVTILDHIQPSPLPSFPCISIHVYISTTPRNILYIVHPSQMIKITQTRLLNFLNLNDFLFWYIWHHFWFSPTSWGPYISSWEKSIPGLSNGLTSTAPASSRSFFLYKFYCRLLHDIDDDRHD